MLVQGSRNEYRAVSDEERVVSINRPADSHARHDHPVVRCVEPVRTFEQP